MATTPPQKPKGGVRPKQSPSGDVELSVFDILNIFRRRWFLSRPHLLANAISAQKAEDGNISWVEFTPQFHSHLVKCAVALVPHPVHKVKKVMFGYILELLNGDGHMAFFELQKGGRKANNAQKEKRRLARKRSRAAKREREREAAKAAKQPPRERQCVACGRKFNSRKTASKHKCPKSKVERVKGEAAGGQASQATPTAKLDKPPAKFTPTAPTPPSNINSPPVVTGDSQDNSQRYIPIVYIQTGSRLRILREDWQKYWETGLWRLG
jgi:5-methylcytosine-specific restriction endonuclease McrA